jgi:hypothetical protein
MSRYATFHYLPFAWFFKSKRHLEPKAYKLGLPLTCTPGYATRIWKCKAPKWGHSQNMRPKMK